MGDIGATAGELARFAASYIVLMAIPGPNFAIVMQAGMSGSFRAALAAASGIACGAGLLSALAMTGISSFAPSFARGGLSETVVQIVFAATLSAIGLKAVRRSLQRRTLPDGSQPLTLARHFASAFGTALCNPVTALFFASSALGPGLARLHSYPDLFPGTVFLMAMGWFGLVGTAFCLKPVQAWLQHAHRPMDAILGAYLIAAGLSGMTHLLAV